MGKDYPLNLGFLKREMQTYRVWVNLHARNNFDLSQWTVHEEGEERISVRQGDVEYSIVLGDSPKLEIWSVEHGEIHKCVNVFDLNDN